MTLLRRTTHVLNSISYDRGWDRVPGLGPDRLRLEPTNHCNLRCRFCSTGQGRMSRPRGYLDLDLVHKIMKESGSTLSRVSLWHNGEPFLHPKILDIIRLIKQYSVYTIVSSNGRFSQCEYGPEGVVTSGLDCLRVSLDAATQETLDKLRPGAHLDEILSGIAAIQNYKKTHDLLKPLVEVHYVITKQNVHELAAMAKLAEGLGVGLHAKSVGFGPLVVSDELKSFIPEREKYSRYQRDGEGNFALIGRRTKPCNVLWHELVVNWDGAVTPCCDDLNAEYVLGNLRHSTMTQIWNGEKMRVLRRSHITHQYTMSMCNECSQHLSSGSNDLRYLS